MLSNFAALKFDSATTPARRNAQKRGGAFVALLRRALPQACVLCTTQSGEDLLCPACRDAMPRVGAACPRCALPSDTAATCLACLAAPPPYAATVAAWRYAFPADRLLQAFKYGGQWIPKPGGQNVRNPKAYQILTDPTRRPRWTDIFLDNAGHPQTEEQLRQRFQGRWDAHDPAPDKRQPD
jgi:hypothetical protein